MATTSSIFTYHHLHRVREHLRGKVTLTAVSDEETFGPWGARYLMEHHPEVHGDCCLNGEPSSPLTIRFGEYANQNNRQHSPNEHMDLGHLFQGVRTTARLLTELGTEDTR